MSERGGEKAVGQCKTEVLIFGSDGGCAKMLDAFETPTRTNCRR